MAEVSEKLVTVTSTESKQSKFTHRRGGVKIPNSRAASLDNVSIERKNKQLNQTTRQLEEKVKSLQERSKTRSLPRVSKVKNHTVPFILESNSLKIIIKLFLVKFLIETLF